MFRDRWRRWRTHVGITDALTALGDTVPAIAETLRAGGHTGYLGSVYSCPVARYLLHVLRPGAIAADIVDVDEAVIAVDSERYGYFEVRTPRLVAAFIGAFDAGDFPDLVITHEAWQDQRTQARDTSADGDNP